ncbi:E3 ubiquitin-protein ligase MARCHF8-like isoform X2 [Lytechinus variegatus]|uniref:E3 ubiquitin-protein ligase MARCHF8-like isoform X2 n=1 Tax=Lytechinus variegatus TaxID=7654 RepID=UPI001BB261EE|nr:E3 ubiquitin-protein ligase MARCHF8-like isoform X2 [Lytechinus variegatus]
MSFIPSRFSYFRNILANRMMPPTSLHDNTNRLPVYSISGSGTSPIGGAKTTDPEPKSPTFSAYSFDGPVCRICHDVTDVSGNKKLITPCGCTGSAQYIHKQCLQKWTRLKGASTCEICNKSYQKKYVKFKMTSSEENTVASAITILLLLIGVLSVGIYLLAEYLVKVKHDPKVRGSSEIWVSISLVIIGFLGMLVFLPWFICFCLKTGKTPRATANRNGRSTADTSQDTSVVSSVVNLSEIDPVVDNAQSAYTYEQQNFEASGYAEGASDTRTSSDDISGTGAYVNQIVQVDGLEEDNSVHDKGNAAVLFV